MRGSDTETQIPRFRAWSMQCFAVATGKLKHHRTLRRCLRCLARNGRRLAKLVSHVNLLHHNEENDCNRRSEDDSIGPKKGGYAYDTENQDERWDVDHFPGNNGREIGRA